FAELWKEQRQKQFAEVHITALTDSQATGSAILEAIRSEGRKLQPDDVFLMFLAGHGTSDRDKAIVENRKKWERGDRSVPRIEETIPLNTFIFCSFDFRLERPVTSGVNSNQIYEALRAISARKILL